MTDTTRDKTTGELRIELRQVREAVDKILNDYERTAKTLDAVTEQMDGLEPTNHADNVQALRSELLDALKKEDDSITPPWEREGYESKAEWLADKRE